MGNTCNKQLRNENNENFLNKNKHSKSEDENYKEYFKLIRHRLRRFYEENQQNQFNISISLDKKDFNTVITSKRISINPSQKFVFWKDFLINYLSKQVSKGYMWANDLLELIKSEIFLSENKWLSLFFWQEFEMRTKPKCLNNITRTLDRDQSMESNSTENYMNSITDRLNGSFVSLNTDSLSMNDPTHEYKEYRSKVKAYINIFKEHVFDHDHPINIVAKYFVKTFSIFIIEKMKDLYTMRNTSDPEFNRSATIICGEITKALQKFILKLQTALRLMYSKTINYQCFIEEKDEFINLVSNLLFRDGKLYDEIYELYKLTLYDQIKILENKFVKLKSVKPEDLGIHEKFCLNGKTLTFQKELLEAQKAKKLESANSEPNRIPTEEDESMSFKRQELLKKVDDKFLDIQLVPNNYNEFSPSANSNATMKLNIQESIPSHDRLLTEEEIQPTPTPNREFKIYSESDMLKRSLRGSSVFKDEKIRNKFKTNQTPYESAIKLLKSLVKFKIPFEKMMLIATISSEITECVNIFWKDFEKVITSSLLNIDADELMTIFIYIIIKSQMSDLLIHSKFIKEFTTSATRSTMMGYYYTTIEASLIYILSIKDKSDFLNRDKMKQSLVPNKTSFVENEDEEDFTILAINTNNTNNIS